MIIDIHIVYPCAECGYLKLKDNNWNCTLFDRILFTSKSLMSKFEDKSDLQQCGDCHVLCRQVEQKL